MSKRPWESKTLWFNFLKAALVLSVPGSKKYLSENPEALVLGDAMINIALRFFSKKPIRRKKSATIAVLLLSTVLVACSSVQQQLDPKVFYKRDIQIDINGSTFEGVTVVPYASKYDLVLTAKGDLDLILLRSCHREFTGEKLSSGWFSKNKFKYTYVPVLGLEDDRVCPLRIDAYESAKGRHSWAFIDFTNPKYQLRYELSCNGSVGLAIGVGVCQAKKGTAQRVRFWEPVRFAAPKPDGCAVPVKNGDWYEIDASLGECLYHFDSKDGKIGRLTQVGYEGVLVREAQ